MKWGTTGERKHVEVKIGIQSAPRELVVETDATADEVEAALNAAVDAKAGVFVLANSRGGRVLVPAEKIAYLEFSANEQRRVGFSSL
jgi:phage tail sheath gpL-like